MIPYSEFEKIIHKAKTDSVDFDSDEMILFTLSYLFDRNELDLISLFVKSWKKPEDHWILRQDTNERVFINSIKELYDFIILYRESNECIYHRQ